MNVLNTAQSLEIRGLTDSGQKSDTQSKSKSTTNTSSSTPSGKRPAAASSPPVAAPNHHHGESHSTAAAPPRKRAKAVPAVSVAPSVPSLQVMPISQPMVKVKAEEVDLHGNVNEEDDVIQMGAADDNDWNTSGGGGSGGPGGSRAGADSSGGGGAGSETALTVGPGGVVGESDYDEDYGGGESGTVATGYEEMGYEGDDYYTEEGIMQIGEGDDRVSTLHIFPHAPLG